VTFGGGGNISGGTTNLIDSFSDSTISGGYGNQIGDYPFNFFYGGSATIGGGSFNYLIESRGTISGGFHNRIEGGNTWYGGTIGGGEQNLMQPSLYGTIAGGLHNTNQSNANYASIGGGASNTVSSALGTIPGGLRNYATNYAFAAGRRAKAVNQGAFVWADSSDADFASTANNQFLIRAAGGVGIGRAPTANALEVEGNASKTTAGSWLANSDKRIKQDIEPIHSALETLLKVRPVSFRYTDDYRAQHSGVEDHRYLNVLAQEFREVFPEAVKTSGEKLPDGSEILQVDTYPLMIYSAAAIQELDAKLKAKDSEIRDLMQRLEKVEASLKRKDRD
jgi:hypothetical protein